MSELQQQRAAALHTLTLACDEQFGDGGRFTRVFAPGRVNLLGDHTDYNEGLVLPVTLGRGVYQAGRPATNRRIRLHSVNFGESLVFDLEDLPTPQAGSWASYVIGVVREFMALISLDRGFDLAIHGDLPAGAGLSSSAALTVSTALILEELTGQRLPRQELVRLCQRVEQRYAGVNCGIMDQFVCALGQAGHSLFLDCRTLAYRHIPLQFTDYRLVVIHSGVSRGLYGSRYNERRAECDSGVQQLRRHFPHVKSLRDVDMKMLQSREAGLEDPVARRCSHVVMENLRVRDAVAALLTADYPTLGQLMTASHASLRDLYAVSCPELDTLVDVCLATEGVLGARMTGAGFGGCAVAVVENAGLDSLSERVKTQYQARTGCEPAIFPLQGNYACGVL